MHIIHSRSANLADHCQLLIFHFFGHVCSRPVRTFFGHCHLFWVDVLVYVQTIGNIGLVLGLESDIVVTQFPRYDSKKGLDKLV